MNQTKNRVQTVAYLIALLVSCKDGTLGPVPKTPEQSSQKPESGEITSSTSETPEDTNLMPPIRLAWSTGFYAGWMQSTLPPASIRYNALTHLIHFSIIPNLDGSLNYTQNSITENNSAAAITAAHSAGKKILVSIGGVGTADKFLSAAENSRRGLFISNIVSFVRSRNYDGVDVDWEYLAPEHATLFTALISELKQALRQENPNLLLTVDVASAANIIKLVKDHIDQINVMTYDLSGAYPGWVSWHNAPIFSGGCRFVSTGAEVPSADGMIQSYMSAGIPSSKLSVGIDFYGYIWHGGTGSPTGGVTTPCQSYNSDPQVQQNVPYSTIMNTYFSSDRYRWDDKALAAYLSIDNADPAQDMFISYDDETSVAKKAAYAKEKQLGGVFVWELGGGYRENQLIKDALLQALEQAR